MYNFQTAASCQPHQDIAAILSLPTDDLDTTDTTVIHEKPNGTLLHDVRQSQNGYFSLTNPIMEDISYASSGSSPTIGLGTDGSNDQFSALPAGVSHQFQTFCNTRQFPLGESSLATAAGDINNTAVASRTEPPLPPGTPTTSLPANWNITATSKTETTNIVDCSSPSIHQDIDSCISPVNTSSICQGRTSKLDGREESAKCRHYTASCRSSVHASADEVPTNPRSDSCWSAPSETITQATVNRTDAVSSSGIDPDYARLSQGTALTVDFFQPLNTHTNPQAGMLAQTNDDGSHSSFSSNSSVRTSTADGNIITQAESQAAAAMLSFPAAAQTMRYDPGLNFEFYRRGSQASIPDAAGNIDYYSPPPMQLTTTGVTTAGVQQQVSITTESTTDLLPADSFNVAPTYSYIAKPAAYQHRASLPNLYFSQHFPTNFCDNSSAMQTQPHQQQQQSTAPNSSGASFEAMYKTMDNGENGVFGFENGLLDPFNYGDGLGSKKKREQSPLAEQRKRRHLGPPDYDGSSSNNVETVIGNNNPAESLALQFTKQRSRSLDFGASATDTSWLNMAQEDDYPDISRSDLEAAKHDPSAIPRRQKPRYEGDDYTPKWVRYTGQLKEGYCDSCKPGKWLQLKNSAYWYHKQFFHGISSVSGKRFMEPLERRAGEQDTVEGLCHQCKQFVPICNAKRKTSVLWYRHAHKCHIYDKPKSRVMGDNGAKRSNGAKKFY